jgi:ankyrin repeat protein
MKGHSAMVTTLLSAGADPTLGWSLGPFESMGFVSPLHTASNLGHPAIVSSLIDGGADPNAIGFGIGPFGLVRSHSPLFTASSNGHTETVRVLLDAGADALVGETFGFVHTKPPPTTDTATQKLLDHARTIAREISPTNTEL